MSPETAIWKSKYEVLAKGLTINEIEAAAVIVHKAVRISNIMNYPLDIVIQEIVKTSEILKE